VALTQALGVRNQLALIWGVESQFTEPATSTEAVLRNGEQSLLESGTVKNGEMIVVMAGRLSGLGLSSSVTLYTVGGETRPFRT